MVCVKKEAAPLVCVLVGGDGVRQRCLVWLVCGEHGHDACVGCGGRRGQDMVGVGASASRGGGDVKKRAPSCVYRRCEGQVRAGDVVLLQWLHGVPGTGEQRGWVLPGTWVGAVWGVVCGEVVRNVCVLCGVVFGRGGG